VIAVSDGDAALAASGLAGEQARDLSFGFSANGEEVPRH
jgi:hypothetical protein